MSELPCCRLESVTLDIPVHRRRRWWTRRRARRETQTGAPGGAKGVRALEEVSLCIDAGDRVGLIGPNGAGKSSLLRVLAGIYQPTRGRVLCRGRISPLEPIPQRRSPGTNESGLESILAHGLQLGLGRRDVKVRLEEIAAFSGLGDHLARPAYTYSQGMAARLAFATYACLGPDILLLDEWIGAADREFLVRARKKVLELSERSCIFVLASQRHDLLRQMCSTGVVLDGGRVTLVGPIGDALSRP